MIKEKREWGGVSSYWVCRNISCQRQEYVGNKHVDSGTVDSKRDF